MQRSKVKPVPTLLPIHFSVAEKERAERLYDITIELFTQVAYRMYASDMSLMRSSFLHSFHGRPFTFDEINFYESMDRLVVTELVFKMAQMHNVNNVEDARLLAKHNVPRLVGLYQSLVCKVLYA